MEQDRGQIRISVQDFGPGIAKESQKRIFERFAQVAKTANSVVASTGLGLHISRAIMEQQNGAIGLDSEEGAGSTFYVEFPAANYETSTKEALSKAPEFAPEVFLLDVMMPGMSGPTTLENLRKMDVFKDTPAIFMTARAQPSEIEELKAISAIAVVVKPFDPITLGDQIMDALNS